MPGDPTPSCSIGCMRCCATPSGISRPADLYSTPAGSKVSNFALLSGVAAHDLYHAGQIQLLKRLSK